MLQVGVYQFESYLLSSYIQCFQIKRIGYIMYIISFQYKSIEYRSYMIGF